MDVIAEHGNILLILAVAFGFFMAWGVGANDVANAMGTSAVSHIHLTLPTNDSVYISLGSLPFNKKNITLHTHMSTKLIRRTI